MKMKTVMAGVVSVVMATTAVCNAAAEGDGKVKVSGAELRARREARIAADGGLVQKPTRGKAVRVTLKVDSVTEGDLSDVFGEIRRYLGISVEVVGSPTATKNPTGAMIAVIDDPAQPTILVAPEDGWATLNVAKLKSDKPSAELLKLRLHKEFWRTFAYLMGAANAQQQPCLMRPITSVADLDSHKVAVLSPGPMGNVAASMSMMGFARSEFATFRKACEEGWAPAPTNDVQKAIWEKVHAMPTEPLKIKPETKKQDK